MRYYAHKGAGHVVSLLDGETLEGQGHNPEEYTAVHLHRTSTPPKVFSAAFIVFATTITVAAVSFALGAAVLGVRFLIGAFA